MLDVVKNQLDFGLVTSNRSVIDFWEQEIGLTLDQVLPVRRGHDPYRFDVVGTVIKLNYLSDFAAPAEARSGYDELWIAPAGLLESQEFIDPDGNRMKFVPPGTRGVAQIGVHLRVTDLQRTIAYFEDVLGFEQIGPREFRCGESVVLLDEDPTAPTAIEEMGKGWSYLTVQVRDCDAEVARIESAGARISTRPINLGRVARMAMVSDPDGNLLEVSQRASLTGPLPGERPGEGPNRLAES